MSAAPAATAADRDLCHCHVCLKLAAAQLRACPRCGAGLHSRRPYSLQTTLALLATAAILLLPANLLPITVTDQLGNTTHSTIVGGVILLWQLGSYPVAALIFIASVVVPIAKILVISYLCWSVHRGHAMGMRERSVIYRITEFIGRWSMIDVFVVAILVALVQLDAVIAFHPGDAAIAFAGVVIATMLAAESFDQRMIWDNK